MFKKLVIAALCVMPFALSAQGVVAKFGHVNAQEIFAVMPERAEAEKELESTSKKYEGELTKMTEEYQNKYKDFVAQQDTLPENIKVRRMQEVGELEQRIQNFREVAMQSIQQQQQQLLAPITKKLTDAISAVGKENSFTYIFDLANGGVLYHGDTSVDVTPLVKTKLGIQ